MKHSYPNKSKWETISGGRLSHEGRNLSLETNSNSGQTFDPNRYSLGKDSSSKRIFCNDRNDQDLDHKKAEVLT